MYTDLIPSAVTGTQLEYKLKAVNEAGESEYSEPLIVTVGTVPNTPSSLEQVSIVAAD